ncbi:RNA-directed DNA polymerase, eukaryota, reverse transcriptase zinc-binding domain protein [Tanacetum coccineum]|uniref:RNA-directed DNA polymerase, eukaryota, reverse transcriptase zinc-binding domain protein n=1 Tax=Tanacetum coccineum TaxID=301880 RepID=A0ABQ5BSE6_9ASTR
MVIGSCISPEQSAFIKGRNILDGPLILNEVMNWYRKRKEKLMIFKVDFDKAFDSLRWDFLDTVMDKLGFGSRWRSWIKGCFVNARSSILVNGSPTPEFVISKGLRQGDPLSPFLFILAIEGLHAFICKAERISIYNGASIGKDNMRVSHLIYADDVIFMGHWSRTNAHNLLCILRCFFLVFGLKINVHKSSLLGVCVSEEDILDMANIIGCGAAKLPMKYLGVPVGSRLLSVGGRLSLIKSILGSLPMYFMSFYLMPASIRSKLESMRNNFFIGSELGEKKMAWVSWKKCLASKKSGGLGIGSIYALNVGLLFKWIWRFLHNHSDLLVKVIKGIYGYNGGIFDEHLHRSSQSPWSGILSLVKSIKQKRINLLSLCNRKLGNGGSTQFWNDIWCGNQARIYMLENDKGCNVVNRLSTLDRSSFLRRNPRGGVEDSQFSELRLLIEPVVLTSQKDSWL